MLLDIVPKSELKSLIIEIFERLLNVVNFDEELMLQILTNLIRLGVSDNNCYIFLRFCEIYREQRAYEMLYRIFNQIVREYLVQKVHVERGSKEILSIVKFFFFGLAQHYDITPDNLVKFTRSLKFMALKNDNKKAANLDEFLEFLEVIVYNNEQSRLGNNHAFIILKEIMEGVKLEYNINMSSYYLKKLYQESVHYVWDFDTSLIQTPVRDVGILHFMNKLNPALKYKGLQNLGNSKHQPLMRFKN